MKRGRPVGSSIRTNIVEILFIHGKKHGYDLHKLYLKYFGKVSQRSIYYHLNKGLATKEFVVEQEKIKGDYSWGDFVQRNLFSLGPKAKPQGILKK